MTSRGGDSSFVAYSENEWLPVMVGEGGIDLGATTYG